jgi:hypothetical protein
MQLRKGKQLIKTEDLWALDIPADTKSRRALDYPIASELGERINVYLDRFRSRIPGLPCCNRSQSHSLVDGYVRSRWKDDHCAHGAHCAAQPHATLRCI